LDLYHLVTSFIAAMESEISRLLSQNTSAGFYKHSVEFTVCLSCCFLNIYINFLPSTPSLQKWHFRFRITDCSFLRVHF